MVGKNGVSLVLRKKPAGKLLNKAHQVDREYRILKALSHTGVPVPAVYALCTDTDVIGQMFYVCEYLAGRVMRDFASVSSYSEREAMVREMARVLATLHAVDVEKVGLKDFGPEGNYYRRQMRIWSRQWEQSRVDPVPAMDELISHLGNIEPQARTTIVHGDYRLENLMWHPTAPRIIGVLDWEISTLGDPRADVAYNQLSQRWQGGADGSVPDFKGIPDDAECVRLYCAYAQQPAGISNWGFHLAFAAFRLSAIAAGVYKRALQGNASDGKGALRYGPMVGLVAQIGLDVGREFQGVTLGAVQSHNRLPVDERTVWYNSPHNTSAYSESMLRQGAALLPISEHALDTLVAVNEFMNAHVFPAEGEYMRNHHAAVSPWTVNPTIERLKKLAKKQNLWNLFLPSESGFTNLEYARMAELMGQIAWASEVFNCAAPDTGNIEILHLFATPSQRKQWLEPLLAGEIRSCFSMTEPEVASSDARNICLTIERRGDNYVLNGRKWYISGAGDPRCTISIVLGKSDKGQSMILVPMNTPGVNVIRPCGVFGGDDSPHGHMEIVYDNVIVPITSILHEEGKGYEIAQARLGPGRIHHCMRSIGVAQRALKTMIERASERVVFGKPILAKSSAQDAVAESALEIEQCRLLTLQAAHLIDKKGSRGAFQHVAMIKIAAPRMSLRVIDRAIQMHGAKGVSQDTWLSYAYAGQRTLRLADGPDEVHLMVLAKRVIKEMATLDAKL